MVQDEGRIFIFLNQNEYSRALNMIHHYWHWYSEGLANFITWNIKNV